MIQTVSRQAAGFFGRTAALTALAVAVFSVSACGKPEPEDNFRLWMNNEAGWEEMSRYVADKNNDFKLRAKALEILVAEGGQPSQVLPISEKAPDRVELLAALEAPMFQALQGGGPKKQGHAKTLLMQMIKEGKLSPAKVAELKKKVAAWAFEGLTPDTPVDAVLAKLKDRIAPEEIEALDVEAIGGAEVMLSKGIAKTDIVTFLKGLKTPEANRALVNGLARYQKMKVNGKEIAVKEEDLAAIQATDSIEAFLYFLDTYLRLETSTHPDDERSAKLAIQVAIDWEDVPANKDKIKTAFALVAPFVEKLLVSKNCDDRWLAAGYLATYKGAEGVKQALAKLPDDDYYGKGNEFGSNDSKLELTRLCANRIKPLGIDGVRPTFEGALKGSPRLIERVIAARCLLALGDPASVAALKAFDNKDPMGAKPVQQLIVSPDPMTLLDLVTIAAEGADYAKSVDEQASKGAIDAATAKMLQMYAGYSFHRHLKDLQTFAEESVKERKEKDAQKAGAAAPAAAAPAAPSAAPKK
ncbi:MAG: hypothetical protein FJ100_04710 [Deltaproteobacteria bacterium]|nr:hypothetical protein [Deltaproteobacteria bacterium]